MFKFFIFILVVILAFILVGAFKIMRFIKSFTNPAKTAYSDLYNQNNRQEPEYTKDNQVIYSKDEIVVLKGEAKDKS